MVVGTCLEVLYLLFSIGETFECLLSALRFRFKAFVFHLVAGTRKEVITNTTIKKSIKGLIVFS